MELFYHALDDDPHWANKKQIVHYHKFMLNVHQFMHTSKQEQKAAGIDDGNPIDAVVDHVLESGRLLCLDEFQVTDVADAMILKELFGKLWKKGCTLVTTSNRPPRDLYLNGLQRDRFLPFVDLLEERCTVVSLMENDTDYRMVISARDNDLEKEEDEATQNADEASPKPTISGRRARQVYFCGRDQKKVLQKLFYERARGRPTNPSTLETQGRKVKIPMACKAKSVCMFSFEDLCQKALGAADYLVIGQHFSTVFVYGIPQMTVHEINWLRRFITFVDSMYEWKVRVLLQTNSDSVEEIFCVEGDKDSYQQDEVFAFDRTRSRLEEMSSTQYLSSRWLGGETSSTAVSKLDLEPSLADQWFQLVGGSLSEPHYDYNHSKDDDNDDDNDGFSKELFEKLDANRDGVLDRDEVKSLMTAAFGYEPLDLVVNEMIASVDTDENGVIDLDEFRALLDEIRERHGRNRTSSG
jgi:predicted ATPase